MRIRHLYRAGEHKYLEDNYGIVFGEKETSKPQIFKQAEVAIKEEKETLLSLETNDSVEAESLMEKMEHLRTLDIAQLRSVLKTTVSIPHKQVMKMKKEEIISELLK